MRERVGDLLQISCRGVDSSDKSPIAFFSSDSKVRREVEKCDLFGGFLVMQSLAGGTGSGLGARLAQLLKDDFQSSFLLNHCVWPYESGEVIVQNYNTLLTLSHLHDCSDGIIVTENESLLQTCKRRLDIPRPTFDDLNKVAAKALASVLLPAERQQVDPYDFGGGGGNGCEQNLLGDMVEHLCSHPAFKMLTMKCAPQVQPKALDFTEFKWTTILKWLRQMLIVSSSLAENLDWGVKIDSGSSINRVHCKSMANFLVLRGDGAFDAEVRLRNRLVQTYTRVLSFSVFFFLQFHWTDLFSLHPNR